MHIAATGAAMRDPVPALDADWQRRFFERHFGAPADGVVEAMQAAGTLWELRVGEARPITPVLFGYMDMILVRPQEQRQAQGVYPPQWDPGEFHRVIQKKLDLLRKTDREAVVPKLAELYDSAAETLDRLRQRATANMDEADYLATSARAKALHAAIMHHLVTGEGDRDKLARQWRPLEAPLDRALTLFLEPRAAERVKQLWYTPTAAALTPGSQS